MSKVRVVTDSNANLPPELVEKYKIEIIPHRIKVGSAYYEEDEEFNVDELFAKHQQLQKSGSDKFPEVRSADINTILDCYQGLGQEAEQVISIHMSSHLSPIWENARKAAEMLKGRYTIRVIDSLCSSFGLSLLVQKAAEAAEAGASLNEIARIINGSVPHLYMTCFSESLDYLERSTRLSPSQSILGTMLDIKAMLIIEEGKIVPLEKVQTREDVINKLYEFVIEFATVEEVGIIQHSYEDCQSALIEKLRNVLPSVPIHHLPYPPSLATYLGPDMIGVIVYEGTY